MKEQNCYSRNAKRKGRYPYQRLYICIYTYDISLSLLLSIYISNYKKEPLFQEKEACVKQKKQYNIQLETNDYKEKNRELYDSGRGIRVRQFGRGGM